MASPQLHIKDSYYFEVPKALWRSNRDSIDDFPEWWIRLDSDFQQWEAEQLYPALQEMFGEDVPPQEELLEEWRHWQHADHHHHAAPLERYLHEDAAWFRDAGEEWHEKWETAREDLAQLEDYHGHWSEEKIEQYNKVLSGKVIIPQPFGTLKNLYEPASGFLISKFMIIQLVVAVLIVVVFNRLAVRVASGNPPKGRFWNMLEAILVFLRDEVAKPAIGEHDAHKFVPLLWTIFLFVLGMNLMGMVPWAGAPTGSFSVTLALAVITLITILITGFGKHGPKWVIKGFVPSMQAGKVMTIILVPILALVWAIEWVGLGIRSGVLAVRLLANMVAGHLVLLGIMMLAFSAEGAASESWWLTATIAIIGSTLFSLLELFVAFLQAYIFTFLSALFIGAAAHHH